MTPRPEVAWLDRALAPGAPVLHDGWDDNVAVRFVVEKGDAEIVLRTSSW